jgi:hypothetical protein
MPDFRPGRFRAKAQYSDPFRIFSNVTHDLLTIRLSRRAEYDRRRLSLVSARTLGEWSGAGWIVDLEDLATKVAR